MKAMEELGRVNEEIRSLRHKKQQLERNLTEEVMEELNIPLFSYTNEELYAIMTACKVAIRQHPGRV